MADLQITGRVTVDASQAEDAFERVGDTAEKMAGQITGSAKKAGEQIKKMGDSLPENTEKFTRSESRMRDAIQKSTRELELFGKTASQKFEANLEFKGLDKAKFEPALQKLREVEAQAKRTGDASEGMGRSFKKAGDDASGMSDILRSITTGGIAAFLGGAVVQSASAAAKSLYEASAAGERLRTMLNFATGGNGAKEIDYLRAVTDRLGLSFESTAKAYGQFAAAAKGTALEGEKARNIFESVSKAAAVMGLSTEQSSGALLALQQMISKGTVQAEELRGQLGERLPGAFQIAAKAMGVTTAELGKMLEAGEVIADDFLPKFAKALEENLGGAVEKAAGRLDAAVNRFDNAFMRLKQVAGDSGVSKGLSNELTAISRDLIAVTDTIEKVGAAGGGMWAELGAGAGVAVARTGFSTLNLVANTLNGTINALTGSAFGLRTDLALLPDVLKTSAQQAAIMASDLKRAEAEFATLKAQSDKQGGSIYFKSEMMVLSQYIAKLKEAQGAKADLTGNAARDIPVTQTRGASFARYEAEQEAATKSLSAERMKGAGVNKEYIASIKVYQDALRAGLVTEKEAVKAIADLNKKRDEGTDAGKAAAKAATAGAGLAKTEQTAYAGLIASIREKIEAEKQLLGNSAGLTESQKIRIKLDQELAIGKIKLSAAHKAEANSALDSLAAMEKQIKAMKRMQDESTAYLATQDDINAAYVAESKAREQGRQSVTDYAKGISDNNDALQYEYSLMGQSAQARGIALEQYRIELDLKKQIAAVNANGGFDEAQREEERARLRAAAATAMAAVSSKVILDEWKKTADSIESSLTDALLRGFESGKGFAKNLRDTLVNMFKTLVLRPIISAVVNPVAGAVTSALGFAGSASAATGAGGLGGLGNIGNLLGSGISSAITGGLSAGFGGLTGTLGSLFGAAGTGATLGGSLSAGGIALGAGNIVGGLSTIVGALGPIALGIGLAVALLSGKKDNRFGAQYAYTGGATQIVGGPNAGVDYAGQGAAQDAVIGGINSLLRRVGSSQILAAFDSGFESSEKGKGFSYAGGQLGTGVKFGQGNGTGYLNNRGSKTPEQALAEYKDELIQATLQALQAATDVPKVIADQLAGVNIDALTGDALKNFSLSIDKIITEIEGFQSAVKILPFKELQGLSFDAASGLIQFSDALDNVAGNGLETLTANLGTYYENFYSEEEKRAQTIASINAATAGSGLDAATATRESFRSLVEAQDLTTEAGRKTYAALVGVAGAFAGITPVIETVADGITDTLRRLRSESETLAVSLLRAQGNTTGADAAQYQIDTAGLTAAEKAVFDYNAGIRAQIETLNAATASAADAASAALARQQAVQAERTGLQDQLNALTDTSAQALARQRDALDQSNRALFDSVEAAKAQQAETQRQAAVATQRGQLEIQIMQLQGDAAGALAAQRAIELAALDATLVPLQNVIYGLQDVAAAAEAAAAAANAAGEAYFAGIDRNANAASFADQGQSALDKLYGTTTVSAGDAGVAAANESLAAAKTAAQAWRGVGDTLRSVLEGISSETVKLSGNAYEVLFSQFKTLTVLARGGDAESAGKIGGVANAFLAASEENSATLADYLRDRSRVENSLKDTLKSVDAQTSIQDMIANSSAAAVTQLTAMNANLTGYAAQVYELLSKGYAGADRTTAAGASAQYGAASADFANYFATSASGASRDFAGGTLTRLGGDLAQFTGADGRVDYIRAGESLLDVGKRITAIRSAWEQQYGITLPAFAVGTNYVPRDMIAQIHEGEAIVPRAYNPAANGGGGQNSARLEALVENLTAEVSALRSKQEEGNSYAKTSSEALQGNQRRPLLVEMAAS